MTINGICLHALIGGRLTASMSHQFIIGSDMTDIFDTVFDDLPDSSLAALVEVHDRALLYIEKDTSPLIEKRAKYIIIICKMLESKTSSLYQPRITTQGQRVTTQEEDLASLDVTNSVSVDNMFKKYTEILENKKKQHIKEQLICKASKAIFDRIEKDSKKKLHPSEKSALHAHISKIREIIEHSAIEDKKKNALMAKLNDLAGEIDRAGTKMDAFFGVFMEASMYAGQAAQNAKPLLDEVRGAMKLLARVKARDEDLALPPGDDVPLLGYHSDAE